MKNNMKCDMCGKEKPDVYERTDGYRQDVNNEPGATHIACDDCDHEHNMDI